jgi:DNA recombination protein RmuC
VELLVISFLSITVILLIVFIFLRRKPATASTDSIIMFQNQLESLRTEIQSGLKNNIDLVTQQLSNTTNVVFKSLEQTTTNVNQQLSQVTNQLSSVTQQLQVNTGQVGDKLDSASQLIQNVQNKLGELSESARQIKEIGSNITKLEELLKAPKMRGGLGELLLEDLLKQVLPVNSFEFQYTFKSGHTVDAIIKTAAGLVPIDSKFPYENFQRFATAQSDTEKKPAYKQFVNDVKKHIDAISQKYIVPDEGTFDFALMYIPADNIYYETIIKDESFGEESGLYLYAISKHIVPVSPNSFYAYLRVIALGLQGMRIEQQAKEIFQSLRRISNDLDKFIGYFDTLGTHLSNAKSNYDKADKQLNTLKDKIEHIHLLDQSIEENKPKALKDK